MTKVMKVLFICLFVIAPLATAQAQVTLTVGNGSGAAGSSENSIDVILDNPSEKVRAVELEVCDVDDYLSSSECNTTSRSSGFFCSANEQADGCVKVVLLNLEGGVIEEGEGPVFTLAYNVDSSAPEDECRDLNPENEKVSNDNLIELGVSSASGEFCFTESTTTTVPPTSSTTTTTNGGGCTPEVTVECTENDLCPEDDCVTCTAETTCDGEVIDGTYEWELNGEERDDIGDSIDVCPEDLDIGLNNLKAIDILNGADGSDQLILGGQECISECVVDVIRDSFPKSHWLAFYPVLIRIETAGIEDLNFLTPISIKCGADENGLVPSILQTGKVVAPNLGTNTTVIWQTALIWPAFLTRNLGEESEICAVTVGDCQSTDTFDLQLLRVGGIPLGK
jgi:hypothetical protein